MLRCPCRKANEVSSMKKDFSTEITPSRYYLREFQLYDGERTVTFNIVGIDFNLRRARIAVTMDGGISVRDYDLLTDANGELYFEYGLFYDKVSISDFVEVEQ